MPQPRLLFISYAHEDRQWLTRLQAAFSSIAQPHLAEILWCDERLKPTDDWKHEISRALDNSSVALLLVSQHFHSSSFIRDFELPRMMQANQHGNLLLTWLRVDNVDYRLAVYSNLQAARDPEPPLDNLSEEDADQQMKEVAESLLQILTGESRRPPARQVNRKRRLVLMSVAIMLLLAIPYGWTSLASSPKAPSVELLRFLHGHSWLAYDPGDFNPGMTNNVSNFDIVVELEAIRRAGFTGIITFGSRPDLARIPALARPSGLAVIMGVWNPLDHEELRAALEQQEYVDAYCVGHNCLSDDRGRSLCTEADLEQAIRWLRRQTGKPVSTTQLARLYRPTERRLNTMGDFLFPDILLNYGSNDVETDIETTVQRVAELADIAQQYDRPLMVKMLTYPVQMNALEEPDTERQAAYYTGVLRGVRDPVRGPTIPVGMTLATAFDNDWKTGGEFFDWDPFTGLFTTAGQPRPAVLEWMRLRQ